YVYHTLGWNLFYAEGFLQQSLLFIDFIKWNYGFSTSKHLLLPRCQKKSRHPTNSHAKLVQTPIYFTNVHCLYLWSHCQNLPRLVGYHVYRDFNEKQTTLYTYRRLIATKMGTLFFGLWWYFI